MQKLGLFLFATIIALSAAAAHAGSFDFERQIGAKALFPTVAANGHVAPQSNENSSPVFADERDIGAVSLFRSFVSEQVETSIHLGMRSAELYNEWAQVWNIDVEIGG